MQGRPFVAHPVDDLQVRRLRAATAGERHDVVDVQEVVRRAEGLPAERARGLLSARRGNHPRAHVPRNGPSAVAREELLDGVLEGSDARLGAPDLHLLESRVPLHQVDEGRSDLRGPLDQRRLVLRFAQAVEGGVPDRLVDARAEARVRAAAKGRAPEALLGVGEDEKGHLERGVEASLPIAEALVVLAFVEALHEFERVLLHAGFAKVLRPVALERKVAEQELLLLVPLERGLAERQRKAPAGLAPAVGKAVEQRGEGAARDGSPQLLVRHRRAAALDALEEVQVIVHGPRLRDDGAAEVVALLDLLLLLPVEVLERLALEVLEDGQVLERERLVRAGLPLCDRLLPFRRPLALDEELGAREPLLAVEDRVAVFRVEQHDLREAGVAPQDALDPQGRLLLRPLEATLVEGPQL
mmetsp:Transcript_26423/g.87435  ORF Transcript_26423/g.87435 Transcript_26423/m.87435 type:complete len:414 (-) Transcript_26423:368-1609(-)